jgi:hypothetical protein
MSESGSRLISVEQEKMGETRKSLESKEISKDNCQPPGRKVAESFVGS